MPAPSKTAGFIASVEFRDDGALVLGRAGGAEKVVIDARTGNVVWQGNKIHSAA